MGLGIRQGVVAAAALLAMAGAAFAQDVLAEHQGDAKDSYYGLSGGTDYDGDGVPDLLANGDTRPSIVVVSGADGATLKTFDGFSGFSMFASAFYPDVTDDGVPEVVVALRRGLQNNSTPGEIQLLNGATGEALWVSPGDSAGELYGMDLRVSPDTTADGRPDVLAAGYLVGRLLSGADGARLSSVTSGGSCCPSDRIAPAGDLNGDGVPDFLVGSQRYSGEFGGRPYPSNGGIVRVVSGADGSILREHRARYELESLGMEVVSLGDFDGDGVADYAVGANFIKSAVRGGAFRLYSGRRGKLRAKLSLAPALGVKSARLLSLVPGDLDRDGTPDFAVQATTDDGGEFFAFVSGRPGPDAILFRIDRPEGEFFGSFGLVGDVDKDGLPDVALSLTQSNVIRIVRTRVLPRLPKVVANAAAFARGEGVEPGLSAVLSVKIRKGVQTLSIVAKGLDDRAKSAVPAVGVWLEDGVGSGTFTQLGTLDASGAYTIVGQGTVPPELGVESLADVVGRRVQLRVADDTPLLETVIPSILLAKRATLRPKLQAVSAEFPKASVRVRALFNPKTGAIAMTAAVRNAGSGPFVLELETAVGSGEFAEIARVDRGVLKVNTGDGTPLAGAFTITDLKGRTMRISAAGTLVLQGVL